MWTRAYHAVMAPQPAAVGGRRSAVRSPTSKARSREPAPGLGDHPRRQVDPGDGRAGRGEVGGHVAGSGADVGDRPAGERGHPVEQPAVEGLVVELVGQVLGVRRGEGVVRRDHARVAGLPALRQHGLEVRDRRRQRRPRPRRVPAPRRCAQRRSCCPGRRSSSRTSGVGSGGHPVQHRLDLLAVGERVQPLRAGAQLAGRLRPAQEQHRHESPLVGLERQRLVEGLVVLQRARSPVGPDDPDQAALLQPAQGLLEGLVVVVGDRVAAAGLVAGAAERVEGQRVRRGDGPLLLQQAAEDALLHRVQDELGLHGVSLAAPRRAPILGAWRRSRHRTDRRGSTGRRSTRPAPCSCWGTVPVAG